MKTAVYIRKSRGQDEDLLKHETQLIDLCKKNNWKYDLFKEIGSSQDAERKEYARMKNNIHKYERIVCMALDRLSREKIEQAEMTLLLEKHDFEIVTLERTYTKEDTLMLDITEMLARQEYRLIKERQQNGRILAFKKGTWIQGKAPVGYVLDRNTKRLIIDSKTAGIYTRIKELALKGYNQNMISETLFDEKITSPNGKFYKNMMIKHILVNKVYLGHSVYKDMIVKNTHEALITAEEYEIIQDYLNNRKTTERKKRKYLYSLSGLIRCANCNGLYGVRRRKDRDDKEFLRGCWGQNKTSGRNCYSRGIRTEVIHSTIHSEIEQNIARLKGIVENVDKEALDNAKETKKHDIKALGLKITKLKNKKNNIIEMCEEGIYSVKESKERLKNISNEILTHENNIEILENELSSNHEVNLSATVDKMIDVYEQLKKLDPNNPRNDEKINKMYKNIIDVIYLEITDTEIDMSIKWK